MKTSKILAAVILFISGVAGPAMAQTSAQNIAKAVKDSCQKELDNYCKAVTFGEGRAFACLYAHSDKLSGHCEYALYQASRELEDAVVKLNHLANSCSADLTKYCANIKAGEGRIANCLKKNQDKTTAECQRAMKETGMTAK